MSKHKAVDKFLYGLGYLYTHATNFGGGERQIFVEQADVLKDVYGCVDEIRNVVTGQYYPPYRDNYDDDELGGLENQKSHRIAHIYIYNKDGSVPLWSNTKDHPDQQWEGIWIECNHLEKCPSEENNNGI